MLCPQCQFANAANANFCQNCGYSLRPATNPAPDRPGAGGIAAGLRGERRVVTVLFCDVAGSTSLAETMDPEMWVEIMNGAFPHLIAPVQRYEGTVANLLGDAILAFFGAPTAHEDDPRRAVLAALEIIERVAGYREQVRAAHDIEFQVRVGINTGLMFVGAVGSGQHQEYTAMGDAVNVAARMEQTAAPGTIQVTEETYRHIAPYFEVQSLGGVSVKGKEAPVPTYRVLRARSHVAQTRGIPGLRAPLVGRDKELAQLRRALHDLQQGRGAIVCLIAEAGLGKTRLLEEMWASERFASSLASGSDRPVWLECHGLSYERTQPYGLVQQLLRAALDIEPGAGAEDIADRLRVFLQPGSGQEGDLPGERHGALLARLLGVVAEGEPDGLPQGEELQREIQEAVAQFWLRQAALRPLVLVFDDLHWADESSLAMLEKHLQLADRAPILFVCAFRPRRGAAIWRLWQTVDRHFPHRTIAITLSALSTEDSMELVDGLLQAPALPVGLAQLVRDKAEGNPFFVEETVRELIDRGVLQRDDEDEHWRVAQEVTHIAMPDSLQALLMARIDRLPPGPRRTLQLASVVGREFSATVLQALSSDEQNLEEDLIALQRAGLIVDQARLPEARYSFRHGLTQDAAYASILLRERRAYHRQVGHTLEQLYAANLEEHAAMLGHHFAEAGEGERAAHYFHRAADRAVDVYANVEALAHYGRAIALSVGNNDVSVDQRRALLRKRGRVHEILGHFEQALADYEGALDLSRDESDMDEASQILLELGFLWAARDYEKAGVLFQQALDGARRLEEPLILAHSLNRVGNWYVNVAQPRRARRVHEEALAILRELGDRRGEAETYDLLGLTLGNAGFFWECIEHYARAIDLFREQENRLALASALATRASICAIYELSDSYAALHAFPQAVEDSAEALALARDTGWRAGESYGQFSRAVVHLASGDYIRAHEAVLAALALAEQIGHRQWLCAGNWGLGCLLHDLCQPVEARRCFELSLELAESMGSALWTEFVVARLARLHIETGNMRAAEETLQRCYWPHERPQSAAQRLVWRAAADLAILGGDARRALSIVESLITTTVEDEGLDPEELYGLQVQRAAALAALERDEEAEAVWHLALRVAGKHFSAARQWRAYAGVARFYSDRGRLEQAELHYRRAQALLDEVAPQTPAEWRDSFCSRALAR